MKWNKTCELYSVSCDGKQTLFNLEGKKVLRQITSQEDAVKFLIQRKYEPFKIDDMVEQVEEVVEQVEEVEEVVEQVEEVVEQVEEVEEVEEEKTYFKKSSKRNS